MTLQISATVTCDDCFEILEISEALTGRTSTFFPEVYAAGEGWRYDTEGHNYCPPCGHARYGPTQRKEKEG